jgi:hypothetical protein
MREFLFPVEYKKNNHWDECMIQKWIDDKKTYLSFSFNRFFPHDLPKESCWWLYLYYTKSSTEELRYQGKLRFRFHVIGWNSYDYKSRFDVYTYPSTLDAKVWFLCDEAEEVSRISGGMLAYEDFKHPEGKNLGSCLRSSIAPAICIVKMSIRNQYQSLTGSC